VKRLRGRLNVVFNKTTWNTLLMDLRNANNDLRWLREQAMALQSQNLRVTPPPIPPVVRSASDHLQLQEIRQASLALYAAIAPRWRCPGHTKHTVKMRSDANVEQGVHMDLVIACGDWLVQSEKE
jgi:hypothetical protein